MRLCLLALGLLSLACGPGAAVPPSFPIELYVSAGLLNEISAFQLSLVTGGTALDCVAAQKACIKDQVDPSRFLKLKDAAGRKVESVSFPISLAPGMPNTQDVSLKEVPVGKDLALIVEAVSKESSPRLAGSSCNYLREVSAGTNPTVLAKIEILNPRPGCDPRH